MTEQTTGRVAQLNPEEWKQLVLLNAAQLQNYLQTIPGSTEGGASGLTDQHMALIDGHIARGQLFMRAWAVSRLTAAPQVDAPAKAANGATNGAHEPTRKGGWPKGKPRTRQAKAPAPAV